MNCPGDLRPFQIIREEMMSQSEYSGVPAPGRLAGNAIGTTHIVFFVVAAAAPLASVVGAGSSGCFIGGAWGP